MEKVTQYDLILQWVDEFDAITPAKMGGKVYGGIMFGSETPKRCRELFKKGILDREKWGKYKIFFRKKTPEQVSLNI